MLIAHATGIAAGFLVDEARNMSGKRGPTRRSLLIF